MNKRYFLGFPIAALLVGLALLLAGVPPWRARAQAYAADAGNPKAGRQIADAKCAACHGPDGNSPVPQYPKLAGQDPAYLYQQLLAFKSGARRSEIMAGIAAGLSRTDAADVASYYARQAVHPDKVKDQRLASLGGRIFFEGGGPGGMPPCAMCHGSGGGGGMPMMRGRMPMMGMMGGGMMGRGSMPPVPNLNGQHAAYVVDQLNRFATGQRPGTVMGRIAAALSARGKNAVAAFVSGQP